MKDGWRGRRVRGHLPQPPLRSATAHLGTIYIGATSTAATNTSTTFEVFFHEDMYFCVGFKTYIHDRMNIFMHADVCVHG